MGGRAKIAGAVAILPLLVLPLAGCGFTPLYATPGVSSGMANIEIVTPEGRTGHLLSEDLQDDLAIRRDTAAAYRLDLNVDEKRYARGLDTENVATWYELTLRVSYALVDKSSGKTLTAGVEPINVSYNAVDDPYAGIVAQQDGQKRAASVAADRIRLKIAIWFAKQAKAPSAS